MYGVPAWNTGLTKNTSEKIRLAAIKNSISQKILYKNMNDHQRKGVKERMAFIGSKCKKKSTSIEIKIRELLINFGEKFEANHIRDGFSFDIYIPRKNLVIECQGDYWHANPIKYNKENMNEMQKFNVGRDARKIKYLEESNINELFIWEWDIKNNFSIVEESIKNLLK